jgi:hypothetical protein
MWKLNIYKLNSKAEALAEAPADKGLPRKALKKTTGLNTS